MEGVKRSRMEVQRTVWGMENSGLLFSPCFPHVHSPWLFHSSLWETRAKGGKEVWKSKRKYNYCGQKSGTLLTTRVKQIIKNKREKKRQSSPVRGCVYSCRTSSHNSGPFKPFLASVLITEYNLCAVSYVHMPCKWRSSDGKHHAL